MSRYKLLPHLKIKGLVVNAVGEVNSSKAAFVIKTILVSFYIVPKMFNTFHFKP
jgi:hypothetical protein